MSREEGVRNLIERVRAAVRAQPVSVAEVPSHAVVRRVAADAAGRPELFATKAAAVGMMVLRAGDADLPATIASLLAGRGSTVVAVRDPALAALATAAAGSQAVAADADGLFDCEVGITDVDAAIAESGSLVVSTRGRIRNAWITPPVHIAIVRASQVLADLVDLFERDHESLDAASTTIITGPSKTADIQQTLAYGAHGPKELVVLLLTGEDTQ